MGAVSLSHKSKSQEIHLGRHSPLVILSVRDPSVGEKMPLQVASPDCAMLRPAEGSDGSANCRGAIQ